MTTPPPDELVTGTDIGEILGIQGSTWGRWVAAGKAPKPVVDRGTFKLYSRAEVGEFVGSLADLGAAGEES